MKLTPWTNIEATDKVAGAPGSASRAMALRDNAKHCQQILYDEDVHTQAGAHQHRGDESQHVGGVYPSTPNLISRPYAFDAPPWHLSGVTYTQAGFAFSTGGQWASIGLGDHTRPSKSLTLFGSGSQVVVSGHLEASTTLTDGTIQMGLINGGDDGQDLKSFVAGSRIDVPAEVLTTSWQRFWAVIDTRGMAFDTSIRFCVQCSSAVMPVGASVTANLFDVRPGQVLDYPSPSYVMDFGFDWDWSIPTVELPFGEDWAGWGEAGSGGPPAPYDHDVTIANAIRIGAR